MDRGTQTENIDNEAFSIRMKEVLSVLTAATLYPGLAKNLKTWAFGVNEVLEQPGQAILLRGLEVSRNP